MNIEICKKCCDFGFFKIKDKLYPVCNIAEFHNVSLQKINLAVQKGTFFYYENNKFMSFNKFMQIFQQNKIRKMYNNIIPCKNCKFYTEQMITSFNIN